ncbi:hypothetical protein [Candidatus Poriferisodalis sp.]|uniref:hypothetical protein n=1 Tax=Candidatus Poriferisodalis sp. TaxID=3101277 RepID=UPI003C70538E
MTISPTDHSPIAHPYRYNGTKIRALRSSISEERFATFKQLAGGDRRRALQLYVHNAALGAAFLWPIQGLEVTLRNAVHREMKSTFGEAWFDEPRLGSIQRSSIQSARRALADDKKPQSP